MAQAIGAGRVEETIYFAPSAGPGLTYALVCEADLARAEVRHAPTEVLVAIPQEVARNWAGGEQVGIYFSIDLGIHGTLRVTVEKDFACLDLRDPDNADAFPNPKAGGHS